MHRQICVCLSVVCVTVALTSPARGQYGNPYELEPMQPYGGTSYDSYSAPRQSYDPWASERREQERLDLFRRRLAPIPPSPFDDGDAACDFMTGNAAAQQRCYESRR